MPSSDLATFESLGFKNDWLTDGVDTAAVCQADEHTDRTRASQQWVGSPGACIHREVIVNRLLRVAILGGGRMAQKHAVAVRLQSGAELVAVADPHLTEQEIRNRFGNDVRGYREAADLLADAKPDIVHIVTPPATHARLAMQCLQSRAHIYVEKPFAPTEREAAEILELAASANLRACAAHQVLFQRAGTEYRRHLPIIGPPVHIESYFSFKPVRRTPEGGARLSSVEQLIDILPHPVYLLLSALDDSTQGADLSALDADPTGEVRAVIRSGSALATLIVTLRGRPIESYLRVVGTNGLVEADFILGDVVKSFGPGASGPAVVVKPFSLSLQKFGGSLAGIARLLFRRQRSYPGLGELLTQFYDNVRGERAAPIVPDEILRTVRICEQIANRLRALDEEAEQSALYDIRTRSYNLPPVDPERGVVLVTGGSGFLGTRVLKALRSSRWAVRATVRRIPSARAQIPGVEYVEADLAQALPARLLSGVGIVVHLAAETMGDRTAHERNTVVATRNLLDAMEAAGVLKLVNIGSVAVLRPGQREMNEQSPLDRGNESRGPYVWAKAEAEALASERSSAGRIDVRTIRLGPLVDFESFVPPGRLGREIVRLFVATGSPNNPLAVCDVNTAAAVIRQYARDFDTAPRCLNLIEAPATSRGELVRRLRAVRPDLKVLWLPFPVLKALAVLATGLQKVLRPGQPALDLYAAFKSERYDSTLAAQMTAKSKPHDS